MKKISLALLIALMLKTSATFAWGKVGHTMVAEIAMAYLNKGVKDSVQKYLGKMTFGEAGTWMDDIRGDRKFEYMNTWHYSDVEKDSVYKKTEEANAVSEIERVITELDHKAVLSKDQINLDLKVLFHLVGDLHQPLHCGYASDKGGNNVDVVYNIETTNLHSSWDTKIIESNLKAVQNGVLELCKKLTPAEIRKHEKINVLAWYQESRGYLPEVYDFKKGDITKEYVDKNLPVIEKQLVIAGLRLASVLNHTFKK